MPSNYILVTPIKNEEKNINALINSIVNQTICPILWVVINDYSTDNSHMYISEAEKKYPWIRCIKPASERKERDLGFHLPKIMQEGFDFAYKVCKSKNLSFDYVGNIDGDIQPDKDYFENLIKEFKINSKLGVASGTPVIECSGELIYPKTVEIPSGGAMLVSKNCFEVCGGIPCSYSYDSVLNVKARLNGWEVKRFRSAEHHSTRYARGADNDWKRYVTLGKSHYYIGYNSLLAILKGINFSFTSPRIAGLAYVYGYMGDTLSLKKKIPDKDVQHYFKYKKFTEIASRHLNNFSHSKKRSL
ncbi:glycosyltransferase family 2 protein [Methanosarcina sp. MSH10X1]|uniref:glycosyltransferase n=1 Tax=Methanosarcina sp. MSH10X1 TaxID=2507075 RepID=UPI000FFC5474|nr:glycosyltransferase family 2 protein [Methanosarcina sp. MSH10X1]RXA20926.1 glycosyltransferase family 2 protein [Methanosarcina sp. MSH10X1]